MSPHDENRLPDPWPAPVATRPLRATVSVPGSKSLSNRYLILAALGSGSVSLHGVLRSRDTELMMGALSSLGVRFSFPDDLDDTVVRVIPPDGGRFHGGVTVHCGLAGTVMRFVPGLVLFADAPVRFDGDEQAYARPMGPLLDGLEQLGAAIRYEGRRGHLPFTVVPPVPVAHTAEHTVSSRPEVRIDASSSSQFISGLLLAASRLPYGMRVVHEGERVPSMPHIRMTMSDVNRAGGAVSLQEPGVWNVEPRHLALPAELVVEPDLSNAAPFLAAAMIAGGRVSVPRWPVRTDQPGGLLPGILRSMGAQVSLDALALDADGTGGDGDGRQPVKDSGTLTLSGDGTIHGLGEYDMSAAGEITPSIAALAVLADAPSTLVGIGHLRGHETDRIKALAQEIRRVGAGARELEDGIEITPVDRSALHGEVMQSYEDHRMATFAAMLGLAVPGVRVVDIGTTRKTIPDFPGMWSDMLSQ